MITFSRYWLPVIVALTVPAPRPGGSVSPIRPPSRRFPGFFFDSFTAVAGTGLVSHTSDSGHTWSNTSGLAGEALIAANGQVYAAVANDADYQAQATPPSANYTVSADFVNVSATGFSLLSLYARALTATTVYEAQYASGTGTWAIVRYLNSAATTLAFFSQTIPVGTTAHVEFIVDGITLTLRVNGMVLIQVQDGTIPAPGKLGVRVAAIGGADSAGTGLHLANVQGRDAPDPAPPFLTDTFQDPAATLLGNHVADTGGAWHRFNGVSNASISSFQDLYATNATVTAYSNDGVPAGADYDVTWDVIVRSLTNSANGPLVRWDTSLGSVTAYGVVYDNAATLWLLQRITGGVASTIGSFGETLTVGTTYHLQLSLRGSTLTVSRNGAQIIAVTDSTITIAGHVGVQLAGTDGDGTGLHLDNLNAVLPGIPGSVLPARIVQRRFEPRAFERVRISISRPRNPDPPLRLPGTPQGIRVSGRRRPRVIILPVPSFGVISPNFTVSGTPIGNRVTGRRNWTYLGQRSIFTPSLAPANHIAPLLRPAPPPVFSNRLTVIITRVPPRTQRLAPFQADITVARPDGRGFRGQALILPPSRTGAPVVVPSVQRLRLLVARRDERRAAGAAWTSRVPDRTLRLGSFQLDPLVIPPPPKEGRRGAAWFSLPHRATDPKPQKAPLLAVPVRVRPGGSVWSSRVPALTLRQSAFNLDALVARRDERRYAGAVLFQPVHRPAAAVIVPNVQRLSPMVVRRDDRRAAGVVLQSRVPARTLRQGSFAEDALIVRRDERRLAGSVWTNRVPARTLRQSAFNLDALIVPPPPKEGRRGAVWLGTPPRATDRKPRKAPLLAVPVPPRPGGSAWQNRVPARTLRLDAFNEDVLISRRDERRYAGAVLLTPVHRPGVAVIVPFTAKQTALVARRDERRGAGTAWSNRVPARTLRLGSFNLDVTLVRRDERRYPGAVLLTPPRRPGATVIVPFEAKQTALLIRRDERRYAGAVWANRAPARTQRQDAFNEAVLVIRRDERRYAGRVVLGLPTRTAAVVITARVPHLLVIKRDERGTAGRGLVMRVPDRTVRLDSFQTRPLVVVRQDQRATRGTVTLARVLSSAGRLGPFQVDVTIVRRDERRFAGAVLLLGPRRPPLVLAPVLPRWITVRTRQSFAFGGRVLWSQPVRLRPVPRLPRVLVVRRDERGYPGRTLTSRSGRQNAVAVLHGNPRAKLTLRPGATAVLTQRPPPVGVIVLTEG